jgi:uncharacterized protein (DUF433 family)
MTTNSESLPIEQIFHADPEILGGTPVFTGTRVPVQNLLEHLEAGDSIDDFLAGFPTVRREQVVYFLKDAVERRRFLADR